MFKIYKKIPVKEFNFSIVADLKRATLIKIELLRRYFLIGFSTVAEPVFCRTLVCGIARFSRGNKNKLRTFQPQKLKRIKNSEPQTKFTGSYKKKECITYVSNA